jgi:hypothetical protein
MTDTQSFDERAGEMFAGADPSGASSTMPSSGPSWMSALAAAPPPSLQEKDDQGDQGGQPAKLDPAYQDMIDRLDKANAQGESLMAGQRETNAKMISELEAGRKDLTSTPQPQLERQPKEPSSQQLGQGMMEFMQVATVLGAMAGGLARGNTTVALTAFAGAVKGFSEGNKQQFDANVETWKAASQRVKDDNQAKLDQYNMVWNNKKLSMDMKLAQIKIIAQQYKDEITYNLAEQKQYLPLAMALQRQQMEQLKFDKSMTQLGLQVQRAQDAHEEHVNLQDAGTDIAAGIEDGRIPPDQQGSYRTKNYTLMKLAKDKFNLQKAALEYKAATKQIQSIYSPQLTRFNATADSVVNTIDEVKALAAEMKNSGVPLANKAKLTEMMQTEGNSPRGQLATRYITAVNTLKEEFATLAQGGYAPTESVWTLTNAQINGDYGVQQMTASLSEIQRLIRYRMQAFEKLDPLHRQIGTQPEQQQQVGGAPAAGDGWSIVK